MAVTKGDIVTAGHICLDMIPRIATEKDSMGELLLPGKLLNVGPVVISTGGSVANTGGALRKLGVPVRMLGKVGDDPFGDVILRTLRCMDERLARHMVVEPGGGTSYTMVISPPGIDRTFLHHPGANDTFSADDVQDLHLEGASLFHFGYPPLMRRFYSDGGAELERLFLKVRSRGLVTSLDMSNPDPESESGRVDWQAILRRVLPHVDVFLPSLDEISFMLGLQPDADPFPVVQLIGGWILEAGAAVAVVKLGEDGLYVRTTSDADRLEPLVRNFAIDPTEWLHREFISTCYKARLVGTTGSGDCTIAGFLAELREGSGPDTVANFATAVGAASVEAPDAIGGVCSRDEIRKRMTSGWRKVCPRWVQDARHLFETQVHHTPKES